MAMQKEMERFLEKIVNMMKDENLFASQGGPIILAQVSCFYEPSSLYMYNCM